MSGTEDPPVLAQEADFDLGPLRVSPSTCRVFVGGEELRVEAQTMSVLIVLWRARAATVSRHQLVEACWLGRVVTDDAVARAIAKVRALARSTTPEAFALETVPKVGYRLSPATTSVDTAATPTPQDRQHQAHPQAKSRLTPRMTLVAAGLGSVVLVAVLAVGAKAPLTQLPQQKDLADTIYSQPIRSTDVADALLNLDEQRVKLYIHRGWSPNWHLDSESNAALHDLMLVCERNPTHDKQGVLRMAKLLIEAGADVNAENGWGDTPLTIASAPRYCGPNHPVTAYLRERTSHTQAHIGGRAR